ncbi:hypothetical protein LTR53_011694 [Teratosphaeriaceae sp. CCFEE 6253]|nr:hypothetical protein LTR53_011694 [Teratosphaeriaceae sp. CCFEE 6253]
MEKLTLALPFTMRAPDCYRNAARCMSLKDRKTLCCHSSLRAHLVRRARYPQGFAGLLIARGPLLSQPPRLALRFEQAEDVVLANCTQSAQAISIGRLRAERTWALDIADDGTGLVINELDADLRDTSTGTCGTSDPSIDTAQHSGHLDELHGNPSSASACADWTPKFSCPPPTSPNPYFNLFDADEVRVGDRARGSVGGVSGGGLE